MPRFVDVHNTGVRLYVAKGIPEASNIQSRGAYQSFFLMSEYAQAYLAITARGVALCSFRIFFAACAMAE